MSLYAKMAQKLILCLLLTAFFPIFVHASEIYQPVRISASSSLSFPADARLNFGQEGTVEFWIAATADTQNDQCVMSSGEADGLNFAVEMDSNRKAIRLRTPDLSYSVPFDFSDGKFHHVAFITSGEMTTALVDGAKPGMPGEDPDVILNLPDAPAGFGDAGPDGQPLVLGCENSDAPQAFDGWLYTLRFWSVALNDVQVVEAGKSYGLPKRWTEGLIAYSTFSNERRSLHYRENAIAANRIGTRSATRPDVTLVRRSILPGSKNVGLSRIFWQNSRDGIRDIRFEYLGRNGIPVLRPVSADWDAEKQRTLRALADELGEANSFEKLQQNVLTEAYTLQGLYNPNTERGKSALATTAWSVLQLQEGEEVWSIAGLHDTGQISALRFYTNVRTFNSPLMGKPDGSSEIFHLKRPAYSKFEGIAIDSKRDRSVRSMALLYSNEQVPEQDQALLDLSKGLWVESDGCKPRLNDELAFLKNHSHPLNQTTFLHGIFTTPTVVKYQFDPIRNSLTQWTDRQLAFGEREDDSGHCGAAQVGPPVIESEQIVRLKNDRPNTFKGVKQGRSHSLVRLTENGSKIDVLGGGHDLPGPFKRAEPENNASRDKIAWGGTFSLPHRPPSLRSNFVGYDITRLDPHNYLRSHGMKKAVFEYPSHDSNNYQTIDNNKIIPNGMIYKNVADGNEDGRTRMFGSAKEYSHEFSYTLGGNLGFGVPGISAAYSANYSHSKRVKNRTDNQLVMSVTRTNVARYSIIADRAKIKLSEEFRRDVLAMRDRELVSLKTPMASFIAKYGTHYPYAVTYGGMAFLETTYSQQVVDHMTDKEHSFESSTSVSFSEKSKSNGCGCDKNKPSSSGLTGQLGVKSGFKEETGLSDEVRKSDDSRLFGIYGGSISRGEGWSVSPGEEVPLLFDLRPISDLLSPIFFDDPIIFQTLRLRLENRVRNYLGEKAAMFGDPAPAWYVSGKPGYVEKQPTVFSDEHRHKPEAKHEDDK